MMDPVVLDTMPRHGVFTAVAVISTCFPFYLVGRLFLPCYLLSVSLLVDQPVKAKQVIR
jgi:hypothetical protein